MFRKSALAMSSPKLVIRLQGASRAEPLRRSRPEKLEQLMKMPRVLHYAALAARLLCVILFGSYSYVVVVSALASSEPPQDW